MVFKTSGSSLGLRVYCAGLYRLGTCNSWGQIVRLRGCRVEERCRAQGLRDLGLGSYVWVFFCGPFPSASASETPKPREPVDLWGLGFRV